MDKINVSHWDQYFGSTEQLILHKSERYEHVTSQFQMEGMAAGHLNAIDTPGMLFTDLCIESDRSISLYDAEPKETAESVFVLTGDVESHFADRQDPLIFGKQQHNLQYSRNFSGTHIIHSRLFHACTITYKPDFLNSIVADTGHGAIGEFNKHLQSKTNFIATTSALRWHQRIGDLILSIRQCPFKDTTRYIFTESKLLELFVMQIEQVNALRSNEADEKWSAGDKEKIYAVREFITLSYLEPLSLRGLTFRFGINEYKLKKGYKYFFQTTVFGDIHRLRMNYARELLAERTMNVTEIAYHIGYNDLSSFSFAYKKAFGCSPHTTFL